MTRTSAFDSFREILLWISVPILVETILRGIVLRKSNESIDTVTKNGGRGPCVLYGLCVGLAMTKLDKTTVALSIPV
jgi:hypothetical protein